jgi:hypothetical protein
VGGPATLPKNGWPVLLAAVLTTLPATARPWGDEAHRVVSERAATTLPEPLRSLFEGNAAVLRAHSVDPDLWKVYRPEEPPNHFMNLDAFDDLKAGAVPSSEAAHLKRHGEEAARHGRLPWRIGEIHDELVAAFRAGDWRRVLETAAVLGHYMADAHVPLHAIVNHDGQKSGQDGLHRRWEINLFSRFQRQIEPAVVPHGAELVSDPVTFAFGVLQGSLDEAPATLAADRAAAGKCDYVETAGDDRYGNGYYSRLFELEGDGLIERLSAAAQATGSLWLSAWRKAGRPELDTTFRVAHVRGESRLVVALLEGAGAPLVEAAAERGALPHLEALRWEGSVARLRPSFPARRAAAQATLWTGAWPERHGVVGDGASRPAGTVLETTPGERSTALVAEPLWVTAAREGVTTVVAGVRQAQPFTPFLEGRRFGGNFERHLILVGPGESGIAEDALTAADLSPRPTTAWTGGEPGPGAREVSIPVGTGTLPGLLFDDPEDPASGLDTLALSVERDLGRGLLLKPVPAGRGEDAFGSVRFDTLRGPAWVHFRLFVLSPDGREVLLWHSAGALALASRQGVEGAASDIEGLLDAGAHRLYRAGALGVPLWEGGDGRAEERYLETLRLVVRQRTRVASLVLDRTRWGLTILSLPLPAEPLLVWGGRLDPSRPGHDPALALRLRSFLDEALRGADAWVGELARRTPPDAALAVLGDRGLGAVDRVARPNVALETSGLLKTRDDGSIDLAQTKVVYAPANGGFLAVNVEDRPGGVQPRRGESLARGAAIGAMREMRDPSTGEPVIGELLMPGDRGAPPGIGGPSGGYLYLRPAPGVRLSPETTGPAVEAVGPEADAFDPDEPSARALLVLTGRGVAGGRSLGDVSAADVAPTLARLLGLPAPEQAQGRPLQRALSSDSR